MEGTGCDLLYRATQTNIAGHGRRLVIANASSHSGSAETELTVPIAAPAAHRARIQQRTRMTVSGRDLDGHPIQVDALGGIGGLGITDGGAGTMTQLAIPTQAPAAHVAVDQQGHRYGCDPRPVA